MTKRIEVGYKSASKLILPQSLNGHELYKLRMDTKIKGRPNIMAAQDDAALRYEILTGDKHVV